MSSQACFCHRRLTRPTTPRIPAAHPASSGAGHSRVARHAAISSSDLARLTGLELEETASLLDQCPRLAAVDEELARNNIAQLRTLYKAHTVAQLVRKRPELLTVELGSWLQFLSGRPDCPPPRPLHLGPDEQPRHASGVMLYSGIQHSNLETRMHTSTASWLADMRS